MNLKNSHIMLVIGSIVTVALDLWTFIIQQLNILFFIFVLAFAFSVMLLVYVMTNKDIEEAEYKPLFGWKIRKKKDTKSNLFLSFKMLNLPNI